MMQLQLCGEARTRMGREQVAEIEMAWMILCMSLMSEADGPINGANSSYISMQMRNLLGLLVRAHTSTRYLLNRSWRSWYVRVRVQCELLDCDVIWPLRISWLGFKKRKLFELAKK
eukprot:scaffold4628_cov146-Skeletonema_dohrnii-CCMP3373.AAC.18